MSIRQSSLICVAYLQVYERVSDYRWWPNIGGLLYLAYSTAVLPDTAVSILLSTPSRLRTANALCSLCHGALLRSSKMI